MPSPSDAVDESAAYVGTILAITHQGQQLGGAAYDPTCNKLLLLEDAQGGGAGNLGFEEDVLNQEIAGAALPENSDEGEGLPTSGDGATSCNAAPTGVVKHHIIALCE